jgi:putative AbiEi antitoxin of type IV toxin-antitoxin system
MALRGGSAGGANGDERPNAQLDAGKETCPSGTFSSPRVERDWAMTRALRGNHGLVTLMRLHRLGFSKKEVHGLVRHGDLRRVHRGVYADGRMPLTDHGRMLAALLAVGRDAWLSGWTAAAVGGLEQGVPAIIDVYVVADHTPRYRGLRVNRLSQPPHPSEITTCRGLRVSSIPRLLIEVAAAGGTREQLDALIEAAVRRDHLNTHDLAATIERNAGRPGTNKVRRACDEYIPHPGRKSGLERSFDRWLNRHPEIPEPQRNIHLGHWEIDCYWPEHELALELDGRPYHTVIKDIERDRRKDAWLQAQRIRILRVTGARWKRDRKGVHYDLTTLLELGATTRAASQSR